MSPSQNGTTSSLSAAPIEHVSLRERVSQAIREALTATELEPGKVYSAPEIAATLGVSPTPVREAMMELSQEGLVEVLRNRGYKVVEFSEESLEQITEVRLLLEVPTIGEVARKASVEEIAALRPLADQLNSTAENGQLTEFIAADTAFHLQLLGLAGNQVLVDQVMRLRRRTRLAGLRLLHEQGKLVATAKEHHQLLDLIAEKNTTGAMELMRQHLGHIRGVWAGKKEV